MRCLNAVYIVAFASLPLLSYPARSVAQSLLTPPEVYNNCYIPVREPTYNDLAGRVAPVFWFSPDEPLLGPLGQGPVHLPAELPPPGVDLALQEEAALYYRISRLYSRTSDDRSADGPLPGIGEKPVPLDAISRIHIRYLAYYPDDIGFRGHQHDLEAVEIELAIDAVTGPGGPCYSIRVARVAGAAHGSDWYTNILEVDANQVSDLVLPPHILVEEGKHASAPDRNADGWFTPGYDSTLNSADAWGVRDTLRNRILSGRVYDTKYAKNRCHSPRLKASRQHPLARRPYETARDLIPLSDCYTVVPEPYALEEAGVDRTSAYCHRGDVVPLPPSQHFLEGLLKKWRFCGRTVMKHPRNRYLRSLSHIYGGPEGPGEVTRRDRWSFAFAWQASNGAAKRVGGSVIPGGGFRVPAVGGWLLSRVSVYRTTVGEQASVATSVDGMYVPSGSRMIDWYLSFGADDLFSNAKTTKFVQEFGVKIRFPSMFLDRVNSLIGIRVGYRGVLLHDLNSGRFVFEAGLGGW